MDSSYNFPVNIGNPNEISIKELSNILLELIETKSKLIFLPLPEDDPTNRKPDITLAKNILNWEPKTDLKSGLIKTISFFNK